MNSDIQNGRTLYRTDAFERLKNHFIRPGSVVYEQESTKAVITEEKKLNVLLAVTENPHISTPDIGSQYTDVSQAYTRGGVTGVITPQDF